MNSEKSVKTRMDRKAKIVATIGPACDNEKIMEALIRAGVNVARINFSHGNHKMHAARIRSIRSISKRINLPVGILQDLQGPKIRVGKLPSPIQLEKGEEIILYTEEDPQPKGSGQKIPVDFRQLFEAVQKGDRLLLDDGRLALVVTDFSKRALKAAVEVGGILTSHKGINLPGVQLRISGYTEKDERDLNFGIKQDVDAVAISFVQSAKDVTRVRDAIVRFSKEKRPPLLIAKVERPEALDNLEAILEVVDGVMVARGDLGVEMPPERVPVLQKHIIRRANSKAKLVITATQMLESMIQNPLPTRAEASDVANAIFDGTDAVMLSAETASGQYPLEAVRMMNRIICEAESHFMEWGAAMSNMLDLGESDAASMARASYELARDRDVTAVAVFTMEGRTAWLMSKVRPVKRILAFTPEDTTFNRLTFLWGVYPQLVPFVNSLEKMIQFVDTELMKSGISPGQQVVVVCGFPVGAMRPPNIALLHTVGEQID